MLNVDEGKIAEITKLRDSLVERLRVLDTIFRLAPDRAFNKSLEELTLTHKTKGDDVDVKKLLQNYRREVITLMGDYSYRLSDESKRLLKNLLLGLVE